MSFVLETVYCLHSAWFPTNLLILPERSKGIPFMPVSLMSRNPTFPGSRYVLTASSTSNGCVRETVSSYGDGGSAVADAVSPQDHGVVNGVTNHFLATALIRAEVTARGSANDTTLLYVITDKPFAAVIDL